MNIMAEICFGGKHAQYDFACTICACYAEGTRELRDVFLIICVNLDIYIFRVKRESPKNNRFSRFMIFCQVPNLFFGFPVSYVFLYSAHTHTTGQTFTRYILPFASVLCMITRKHSRWHGQHSAGRPSHVSSLTRLFADPPRWAAVSLR